MEQVITCQDPNCHKSFKVVSTGDRADYSYVPDVVSGAPCPYCLTLNRITWPKDVKFITAPNV
jgi:hypothetical protein